MLPQDRDFVVRFFERDLDRFGPDDPRALHWDSAASQTARYRALRALGAWDGATVADVGCGLGDFYGFLREPARFGAGDLAPAAPAEYTGYDLAPRIVAAARRKYPTATFAVRDVLEEGMGGAVDYVVACGLFNVRVQGHESYLRVMIARMFEACRRGFGFNFLEPATQPSWADGLFFGTAPDAVVGYCRGLGAEVTHVKGYLPGDHTVFMWRQG